MKFPKLGLGIWFVLVIGILGIGMGIVGFFDPKALGSLLFQPGSDQVITFIAVGLPVVIVAVAVGPLVAKGVKKRIKK